MKKIVIYSIIIMFVVLYVYSFHQTTNDLKVEENPLYFGDKSDTINPSQWVAVDGLGRALSTNKSKSSNHSRYVGIFFWTWHAPNDRANVINVNNVNKENPTHKNDYEWWNNYTSNYTGSILYWWNEPIYGYYLSEEYVLRKQAELLADAGVDFVVFDCTNGDVNYTEQYERLLKVWKEAKSNGINVPKIAFMLPFAYSYDTYDSFMYLYNRTYNPNSSNYKNYSDLYFKYNGKPLVLLSTVNAPSDMMNVLKNFEYRRVEATYFYTGAQSNGVWGWLSSYPQAYYKKANGQAEQISVGTAQNASYQTNKLSAMNGSNIMGRSYAKDNYSYSYVYKNQTITVGNTITGTTAKSTNTSLYGRNFQQQWDYAISVDPEIVFVTGWNEWIMGRYETWQGVKNAFPDQFNDEYSRDIEPSKGELKDYYYYQLVENIRRYKGVSAQTSQMTPVTINNTSDWNNSNIITYNHYTGGINRDSVGAAKKKYINNTFRNDIKKAKVSYDSNYMYFYVETVNNLNSYSSDKWMRLLIDTQKNNNDNWEEFEFILNRTKGNTNKLLLEKSQGGWSFDRVGEVDYKVTGNILEVKIPRSYLGLTNNSINFNFKWCDNNLNDGDIMTLYTDGDAAPGGRFAFHFEGSSIYQEIKGLLGDVNLDGKVNSTDYILIRKYLLDLINLSDNEKKYGDANNDGNINSSDYIKIRKIILNGTTETINIEPATPITTPIVTIAPTAAPNLKGWQENNNKWYYYNENGKVLTGWQQLSWSGGIGWFYFDNNGVMKTGWQKLSWSGGTSWFYFDPTNGNMISSTTKNIDGKKYAFDSNGVCTTMPDCKT